MVAATPAAVVAYTVMNIVVLGVMAVLSGDSGDQEDLESYRGLGRCHPWLGPVIAIGVLSLASLPPTAGSFAKLLVFVAARLSIGTGLVLGRGRPAHGGRRDRRAALPSFVVA